MGHRRSAATLPEAAPSYPSIPKITKGHFSITNEIVELLSEHGFDGMAEAKQLMMNECMKIERRAFIGVGPYQRGEVRNGQGNGFKPKHVKTRVGELELAVPQVRAASFYPSISRAADALRPCPHERHCCGACRDRQAKPVHDILSAVIDEIVRE